MTRSPKQKAKPLARLREERKESATRTSGVAADVINCLLEYARAAAAAIRARVAAVVDIALAAVDVAATVFVMNHGAASTAGTTPTTRAPSSAAVTVLGPIGDGAGS
ncbi:hypothetical protein ACWC0C_46695 [Streptomyces sp. NPDC001709]